MRIFALLFGSEGHSLTYSSLFEMRTLVLHDQAYANYNKREEDHVVLFDGSICGNLSY